MEHSWILSTPRLCLLAIIFIAGSSIQVEARPPRCPAPCEGDDCPVAQNLNCEYGSYLDYCGRSVCAKGPRDFCGDQRGMFWSAGRCGDGMTCRCGRCVGCSLVTMLCYHPEECRESSV